MADNDYKLTSISTQNEGGPARHSLKDPYIGEILSGRYKIIEMIGAGGWGNVYKAKHLGINKDIAVKIIHEHHLQNETSLKRMEQEAQTLSRLDSPYVVKIIDYGSTPAPFIAMEYFDGIPLNRYLREHGTMSSALCVELFLQIAEALRAANALGVVHRDLKPANILLKTNGIWLNAKVLDFGLVKFLDANAAEDKLTNTGEVLGSPAYMAPEQWKGNSEHRSDIYALGCMMFEVLSGHPAFSAKFGVDYLNKHLNEFPPKIAEVNKEAEILPGLEGILRKCIQKDPVNRYHTASAFMADLKKVRAGRRPDIVLEEKEAQKISAPNTSILTTVVAAGGGILILVLACLLLKDPVIGYISEGIIARADAELQQGRINEAMSDYRNALNWIPLLSSSNKQKMHAIKNLISIMKLRNDSLALKALEKQYAVMTGAINLFPDTMLLLEKTKTLRKSGNLVESEVQAKLALEEARARAGERSMAMASCLSELGVLAQEQKQYKEAVDYQTRALNIMQSYYESKDSVLVEQMDKLAMAMRLQKTQESIEAEAEESKTNRSGSKSPTNKSSAVAPKRTMDVAVDPGYMSASTRAALGLPYHSSRTSALMAARRRTEELERQKLARNGGLSESQIKSYYDEIAVSNKQIDKLRKKGQDLKPSSAGTWFRLGDVYFKLKALDKNNLNWADYCYDKGLKCISNIRESVRQTTPSGTTYTVRSGDEYYKSTVSSYLNNIIETKNTLKKFAEANAIKAKWQNND